MSAKITRILLLSILFVTSCSSQNKPVSRQFIDWGNLQITPRPEDDWCTEIFPEQLDYTGEEIKRDFSYGLAQSLFPKDIFAPRKIAAGTYWINENEPLTVNWLFWYPAGNKDPINLRIFILLDEQQLTNALPQSGSYNDLHFEKGTSATIQVRIPPLPAGVHEVTAVAVPSPENDPDEYGTVEIISSRMTLIAEPSPSPFRKTDFTYLHADGSNRKGDPAMAIELALQEDNLQVWNWPDPWFTVNIDESIRFYALAGHEDVTNLDAPSLKPLEVSFFAILLFIDYQQVEVAPNQTVLYGVVNKDNAYTRIPVEIPSLPEGKHHILALRIDTPGAPYCILRENPRERILPFGIYGRLVGINVLPSK